MQELGEQKYSTVLFENTRVKVVTRAFILPSVISLAVRPLNGGALDIEKTLQVSLQALSFGHIVCMNSYGHGAQLAQALAVLHGCVKTRPPSSVRGADRIAPILLSFTRNVPIYWKQRCARE